MRDWTPRPADFRTVVLCPLLALSLAACMVGPDHLRPEMPVAARFADTGSGESATAPESDAAFWEAFGDPQLTALVEAALAANHDLRIALANHERARALLRGAEFDRLPNVRASTEMADAHLAAVEAQGGGRAARDRESYRAGVAASWELDMFGRVRRRVEASRADAAASGADLASLQVVIVGEVVAAYIELRGAQERLRVAHANADNQRRTLELVQARFGAGRGTDYDAARTSAQLASTLARVPALQAEVAVHQHRLAVLTGRSPDALLERLSVAQPLPAPPPALDPGTPGELLRRRPDIAAAEHRLHAATARIGVATADLFPRFTLGGLIGSYSTQGSQLFAGDSETRLVALGIDWSFLDVGRVRARMAAADAEATRELARYEQTVLLALEDVENALVRHARSREEDAHLQRAAEESTRAAQLAITRFQGGAAGLLEVLDSERTLLQAEDALALARTRTVASAAAIYRSLAGGWPQQRPACQPVSGARRGASQ
jgi:NodT family efflux transporter outer membrane factor (OMF) lipoprotein